MADCARCARNSCYINYVDNLPGHCPMLAHNELFEEASSSCQGELKILAANSARIEAAGYGIWTRLREVIEFARLCGYKKLGLAFCVGLRSEAREVCNILENSGFQVASVMCKTGARPKEELGLRDDEKVHPGQFEAMCNPIAQAMLLNRAGTHLNVLLGLCVGHDTLFFKHATAPVTVLAVKDRVTGHNPLAAVYANHYFKNKV